MDWDKYAPYFTKQEFDCKVTGRNKMNAEFMDRLFELRTICGFPFRISSGYRHTTHPIEAKKKSPGEHTFGVAADIMSPDRDKLMQIIVTAYNLGFRRIGINFKSGFVHLGIGDKNLGFPSVPWTY